MKYHGIEIFDAKDRDMLIKANLSDVQEMILSGLNAEAIERLNAIKLMMIDTKGLLSPEIPAVKKQLAEALGEWGGTNRFLECNG